MQPALFCAQTIPSGGVAGATLLLLVALVACDDASRSSRATDTAQAADTAVVSDTSPEADTASAPDTTVDDQNGADTGSQDTGTADTAPDVGLVIPESCGAASPEALVACVSQARFEADLAVVAGPRAPGSTHHQEVQDHCASVLTELGFTVERHDFGTGVNVVGTLPGLTRPNEHVVLSAHYDGIAGCDAADDNASGVAGILEAARALAQGRFERSLVVACWDREEDGLEGSIAWAQRATDRDQKPLFAFVFEMIGYTDDAADSQEVPPLFELLFPDAYRELRQRSFRGDFIALVDDELAPPFVEPLERFYGALGHPFITIEASRALLESGAANDLFRSDHAAFWLQDVSTVLIGDTANFRNPYYHCRGGEDAIGTLDMPFATQTVRGAVGAVATALVVVP